MNRSYILELVQSIRNECNVLLSALAANATDDEIRSIMDNVCIGASKLDHARED